MCCRLRKFVKLGKIELSYYIMYYIMLPTKPNVSMKDSNYGGRGTTSKFLRGSYDEKG